jgi:hypothetical protein
MKRSEKLYFIISILLGITMLFVSYMVHECSTVKDVLAGEVQVSEAEQKGKENSFRYKDGESISTKRAGSLPERL